MKVFKGAVLAAAMTIGATTGAVASTVIGGSLLNSAGADQLETWLGVGDQDFTNVWAGDAGIGLASDWHSAVDGVGATFSIYDVTLGDGASALIGGYTALDWGVGGGFQSDATAFIFNLTTGEVQFTDIPEKSVYSHQDYFASFGGGLDLFGGSGTLGTCFGGVSAACDGYTWSHSYDQSQGQISIADDTGIGSGDLGARCQLPAYLGQLPRNLNFCTCLSSSTPRWTTALASRSMRIRHCWSQQTQSSINQHLMQIMTHGRLRLPVFVWFLTIRTAT